MDDQRPRCEALKLLKENLNGAVQDTGVGKGFSLSKARLVLELRQVTDKWDLTKLNRLWTASETIKRREHTCSSMFTAAHWKQPGCPPTDEPK